MAMHSDARETEQAILAGGCFWCLEAVFEEMAGVLAVESGYTGGFVERPSYYDVCSGETGHAEAVRITFDPAQVSYVQLLAVFFTIHDPTTLNRQGEDVGTQYRSAIYATSPRQRAIAEEVLTHLTESGVFPRPIVTELTEAGPFYVAEPEHQGFYRRHPYEGYCQVIIAPKLAKFRQVFANLRRPPSTATSRPETAAP